MIARQSITPELNVVRENVYESVLPIEIAHVDNDVAILPEGDWKIRVLDGAAWVFLNDTTIVIHVGEEVTLQDEGYPITVRSLYEKGNATYTVAVA